MCQIVQDVGTCLIGHTKGPGKCVGLYRMSEYPGFVLVTRNTLGPNIFVECHRMSENSAVGLHKFHCIYMVNFFRVNVAISGLQAICVEVYFAKMLSFSVERID